MLVLVPVPVLALTSALVLPLALVLRSSELTWLLYHLAPSDEMYFLSLDWGRGPLGKPLAPRASPVESRNVEKMTYVLKE